METEDKKNQKLELVLCILQRLQPNVYTRDSGLVKELEKSIFKYLPLRTVKNLDTYIENVRTKEQVDKIEAKKKPKFDKPLEIVFSSNPKDSSLQIEYLSKYLAYRLYKAWREGDILGCKRAIKDVDKIIRGAERVLKDQLWNNLR